MLTLCESLLRFTGGGAKEPAGKLIIPEVLIGDVSRFLAEHKYYTSLRGCAGFFLFFFSVVT
ncbi:hypothetical protein A9B99_16375 [Mangrovibacter phragmitis]|uniref:Uncharacterized protein n=1 Tax=Mangrovibacter phragmitis TaxID=1691903 RepID=A0A1B7KYJ0_9ENTR|nr:hypothetical protein A9B99_16375 [Mangrovibacter phragmitis]